MTANPEEHFVKIGGAGDELPLDATEWQAVIDRRTGLMWTVEEVEVESQQEAEKRAKEMTAGGFTDWRLPTVEELFLLADRTRHEPAIDTRFFPACESDWYWSSTPAAPSGGCAWVVDFDFGDAGWVERDNRGFIRAVRAGQS